MIEHTVYHPNLRISSLRALRRSIKRSRDRGLTCYADPQKSSRYRMC